METRILFCQKIHVPFSLTATTMFIGLLNLHKFCDQIRKASIFCQLFSIKYIGQLNLLV